MHPQTVKMEVNNYQLPMTGTSGRSSTCVEVKRVFCCVNADMGSGESCVGPTVSHTSNPARKVWIEGTKIYLTRKCTTVVIFLGQIFLSYMNTAINILQKKSSRGTEPGTRVFRLDCVAGANPCDH